MIQPRRQLVNYRRHAAYENVAIVPDHIKRGQYDISGVVTTGFLRQGLDAVTAGLTLPWSSGVVEGHVDRVKPCKRGMYGRASFGLLRTRILGNGP